MQKFNYKQARQSGFTLIELVVVMVILGILAATAIPKFADMSAQARIAKMSAGFAAVKAASAQIHASCLAQGQGTGSCVTKVDGVDVTAVFGYPSTATIASIAGLSATDYPETTTGSGVFKSDASRANCSFTYAQPGTAGATPTISETFTGETDNVGNCE